MFLHICFNSIQILTSEALVIVQYSSLRRKKTAVICHHILHITILMKIDTLFQKVTVVSIFPKESSANSQVESVSPPPPSEVTDVD